ncbi:hypothetical protein CHISP_0991 [Chitinispirillum alkaliphilum]|nr:hypothetical protein CHISP_0991 [Chitinispirillum alkaliphilum]
MNMNSDHDRYVAKNRSLASAEEISRKDGAMEKKGFSHLNRQKESSCFNCKMKKNCSEFKAKSTGRSSGVVSFGGEQNFICDRYAPAQTEKKSFTNKQIKSLLKNAKKGL